MYVDTEEGGVEYIYSEVRIVGDILRVGFSGVGISGVGFSGVVTVRWLAGV